MWAHYANSHRGFVIEFDTSDDFFAHRILDFPQQPLGVHQVKYVSERPALNFLDKPERQIQAQFLSKGQEWEPEQEWRCFRHLSNADRITPKNAHLFRLPLSCIKSVTLGAKMWPSTQTKIINILKNSALANDFVCEKAYIKSERYALGFRSVEI